MIFNTLREVKDSILLQKYSRQEFISLMRRLLFIINDIPAKKLEWLKYLTRYQIEISSFMTLRSRRNLSEHLKRDFDNLTEYDKLKEQILFHEKGVITKLYDHVQEWNADKMETLLENSLGLTWIDHIETKYPIFVQFHP